MNKITPEIEVKLRTLSNGIVHNINVFQDGKTKWNKLTGQWIVYGLERSIGFIEAAELCGIVEEAFKKKQDLTEVIYKFHADLYNARVNGKS